MSSEFVNDSDTKELLSAIEQYARARGRGNGHERVQVAYLGEYDGRAFIVERAEDGSVSERRFNLIASHWYEELP